MARAGPLIYTAFFLLLAYSLSAGNAGTAFRYRMHLVAVALCAVVVIRWLRTREQAEPIANPLSPSFGDQMSWTIPIGSSRR
jgi:Na+/melibiose symporter-like transporter